MKTRHKVGVCTTLSLFLVLSLTPIATFAKSSPSHDSNATTTENANTSGTVSTDRSTDKTQDESSTTTTHLPHERHHSTGKRRAVIIGGTALTGMLVGAHVAGPVGALAGAGVGAGVGLFLSHIF